jgi:hypothetical protein
LRRDRLYFLIFATIHDVLKAERTLKDAAVDVEVIPVPRVLSSDCGVCIKSGEEPDVLAPLIGHMKGVRCFVFDGTGYKPERALETAI